MPSLNGVNGTNGVNGVNGMKGVNGHGAEEEFVLRPRQGSRSLPFLTDTLGYSLNDRLLFAVPKSRCTI